MRTLALLIVLTFLAAAEPAAARTLRVLTYNIHHSEGRDGRYDLNRIANVIKAANPDIVALQELDQGNTRSGVNVFQLDKLAELTDMQGRFGKTINYSGGEYGNGILVAAGLDIVQTTNRPLPSPNGGEARAVLEMKLSFDPDRATAEFIFLATHLNASNEASRNAQATFINNLAERVTTPMLLAGDMNARPTTEAYARLAGVWTDSTNLDDPGIARSTQIDYIFHRSTGDWEVKQSGRFIVNATTAVASDHYPMLTEFNLPYLNADFDGDYDVDGGDFLLWQRHRGSAGTASQGDANEDGQVDSADLQIWRSQFGTPRPRPTPAAAVPEPSGAALTALAVWAATVCRPRPISCAN